jgi:hypothetical protein
MGTGGLADGTLMDKEYPAGAWRRLGEALEARRGQLGYGFRQREKFLADRGGPPPSVKTLARLERGERTAYPPGTVTRLESLYECAPGAFEAFLANPEAGLPPAVPARPPLHPVPPAPPVTAGSPDEAVLAALLSRYKDDGVIQAMGTQGARDRQPAWQVVQEILWWLERNGHEAEAAEVLAALLSRYPGSEVIRQIGRQYEKGGKKASMVTAEILEFLSWRPPEAEAGNGTTG